MVQMQGFYSLAWLQNGCLHSLVLGEEKLTHLPYCFVIFGCSYVQGKVGACGEEVETFVGLL